MIVNELLLKNFMCYYDINTFQFSDRVNIILGHNGDGKTTIFTAFKWIFNPLFTLPIRNIYSEKRFNESTPGEQFDVIVSIKVKQYNCIYSLEKSFSVTNSNGIAILSPVRDSVFFEDKETGESGFSFESFNKIIDRVFPRDFRNFSVFETETETLEIVKGSQLSQLVQLFSNAKYFEELETSAININRKAAKAYNSECKADTDTKRKLNDLDIKIVEQERIVKDYQRRVNEDIIGKQTYTKEIDELVRSNGLSEALNRVNAQIQEEIKKKNQSETCRKPYYTNYLFDEQFFLVGYTRFKEKFEQKVDDFRILRNQKESEELAKYVEEKHKLTLEGGITPLPPGSPTEKILNEFLTDNICKICGRTLDKNAVTYINKSLTIYQESKKITPTSITRPAIFSNTFIPELVITDQVLNSHMIKDSIYSLNESIADLIEFNSVREKEITQYTNNIKEYEREKNDILNQVPSSLTEDKLVSIMSRIPELTDKLGHLEQQIGRNTKFMEDAEQEIEKLKKTKKWTLAQTQSGSFKRETTELLDEITTIFGSTKEREYKRFLNLLENKATTFLKKINKGEATGIIKLTKVGDEIIYKSVNEDGSFRSDLKNSGALTISIPLAILFAISDLATEIREDESYPMIFDAPTGRFSPDREIEFFNALFESGKQRIIVTLRFLLANEDQIYIDDERFSKIPRHKAFHILRERPIVEGNINTNVIQLN